MDNFVGNRDRENNNKRELCLFYSTIISFEKLLFANQNIRTLIIIGQRDIASFSAISELTKLQELWIVECGIKDVPSFEENCLLKKLYLYSNEISYIPNLKACPCLTVLYLSRNNIKRLENLEILPQLQELNLADNKLERINKIFWKKSDLQDLNLAGNPLCLMRDIRHLSQLQKLNSLVFADPLYGDCPLVTFCNYRIYVIHHLPHIKKLDHYKICENERYWINYFFKKQLTYCNVLLHKQLNMHSSLLKHKYKEYEEEVISVKNQLYAIEMKKNEKVTLNLIEKYNSPKCGVLNELQNIMLRIKLIKREFVELEEMLIMQLKILQQQLLINIYYCGNISFVEYNSTSENTVIELCRQYLQASLCPILKDDIGIIDLKLHKVTKVSNREIEQLNIWKNESHQSDECNTILKILASPGLNDIQKWPFNFFQTGLFMEEKITVTNCLAAADFDWLNNMFSSSKKEKNILSLCSICEKRRVCVLVQTPIFNSAEKTNNVNDCLHVKYANNENNSYEICQTFQLMSLDIKNPMFIIEFEYVFQEVIDEKNEHENMINTCAINNTTSICLTNSNIRQYVSINQKVEVYNLVKICISGQNINSIDTDFHLPKLTELDISYNQLNEFPNVRFIKNVKILNISFNNIKLLHIEETLPMLEELDISWNLLMSCIQSISTFKTFIPNMYNLKIYNNPFSDVSNPQLIEYLIYIYLPKLQFINNCKSENLNLPQNYFPCAFNMCKLNNKRRNKWIYIKNNSLKNMAQMKLLEKKNIEQAKYIHISQDFITASNVLKRIKNVQEFCATCCLLSIFSSAKPLNYLIKLNLGNNFISILDGFTQENFPALKYLDLTNNLITSLAPMGSFYTLQEFYCGNNKIRNMAQIDNIKTWQRLCVIDFCNNPINTDPLHKKFIIFHLCNIEYISGEYVQGSDVSEATYIFGNKFDKHVLNTIYETNRLTNITQLSLVDCFLSKVDLSAELLPQLESLDLSKNQITYLWGLQSFKHLQTLCLSYNCLQVFDLNDYGKTKCIFPKLYTLLLDHNCIKSVMNITRQKLPVIKHLFLNNNHLQNINEIVRCSTLKSLILDYNEIEVLITEDFIENDNLEFLSLENNRIKSLDFIKSLKRLKKLYVAHNCLASENEIQYLLLLKNLEEITFEGNPSYNETNINKIIVEDFGVKGAEIEEI